MIARATGISGALVCAVLLSAAATDFSGEWRLVVPRSRAKDALAKQWMPRELTKVVEQKGDYLTIKAREINSKGEFSASLRYRLDGTETENEAADVKTRATARWSGKALIVDSAGTFQGSPIRVHDRWEVSRDRRTLTVHRHFEGPPGRSDQDLVFERAERKK